MAKKKKFKFGKHTKLRNAAPRAPRTTTPPNRPTKPNEQGDSHLKQLGYTAAGAAGTALVGSFLAHEGWAPKTIATALAAVGAGLAWKGDAPTVRSIGAGVMSAAGSQLALMLIDDHEHDKKATNTATKKPANADGLPPQALENAFERARERLSYDADND